jgi:hypothetical protein
MSDDKLFNSIHLSEFIKQIHRDLSEEIKSLDRIKGINFDLEKEKLISKYKLGPLMLLKPVPGEPKRERKTLLNNWGEQYVADVYLMKIKLPFEGNGYLFYCQPSTYAMTYPKIDNIDINQKVIYFTVELSDLDENIYLQLLNSVIAKINENVSNVNKDILNWDNALENLINSQCINLKSFVEKKNSFYEKVGLKINPEADKYISPSPVTRRKIPQPTISKDEIIKKIIPTLQDEIYKDILNTLYNVGKAIEKKPSIYKGKSEPDLRDILLLFLETRYESTTASAETFNKGGRADIVLKFSVDSSNLFVAECKIWSGINDFHIAIDQLLGYLTLRDSKSALIIFVDNKKIIETKDKICEQISSHPSFVKYCGANDEYSLRYKFSLPEDDKIYLEMEVMLFHFPERK